MSWPPIHWSGRAILTIKWRRAMETNERWNRSPKGVNYSTKRKHIIIVMSSPTGTTILFNQGQPLGHDSILGLLCHTSWRGIRTCALPGLGGNDNNIFCGPHVCLTIRAGGGSILWPPESTEEERLKWKWILMRSNKINKSIFSTSTGIDLWVQCHCPVLGCGVCYHLS